MFLKKLFYASAFLLMLAAAYHIGPSTATAQAPGTELVAITGFGEGCYNIAGVSRDGGVYFRCDSGGWQHVANLPGEGAAVYWSRDFDPNLYVGLRNGDVWVHAPGGSWEFAYLGNMFGGPTPVAAKSWGALKAKYR
jgi:hypothetical protein